jgi:hypothetical protein
LEIIVFTPRGFRRTRMMPPGIAGIPGHPRDPGIGWVDLS